MWINLYHGTTASSARMLLGGAISTSVGGGEYGQGFYMGESRRLARRRAFHKSQGVKGTAKAAMSLKGNTLQIELNVPRTVFSYSCCHYNLGGALRLYRDLKKHGSLAVFKDSHDALIGPIVGCSRYYQVQQYKFQSARVENALNYGCPSGAFGSKKLI